MEKQPENMQTVIAQVDTSDGVAQCVVALYFNGQFLRLAGTVGEAAQQNADPVLAVVENVIGWLPLDVLKKKADEAEREIDGYPVFRLKKRHKRG